MKKVSIKHPNTFIKTVYEGDKCSRFNANGGKANYDCFLLSELNIAKTDILYPVFAPHLSAEKIIKGDAFFVDNYNQLSILIPQTELDKAAAKGHKSAQFIKTYERMLMEYIRGKI
jgi:hypothetical protein